MIKVNLAATPCQFNAMNKVNIRHDIDRNIVMSHIFDKLAQLKIRRIERLVYTERLLDLYEADVIAGTCSENWVTKPTSKDEVNRILDEDVERQLKYYSTVRVIELPQEGDRFILVYGDADDALVTSGTGPFESKHEAANWFLRGGR